MLKNPPRRDRSVVIPEAGTEGKPPAAVGPTIDELIAAGTIPPVRPAGMLAELAAEYGPEAAPILYTIDLGYPDLEVAGIAAPAFPEPAAPPVTVEVNAEGESVMTQRYEGVAYASVAEHAGAALERDAHLDQVGAPLELTEEGKAEMLLATAEQLDELLPPDALYYKDGPETRRMLPGGRVGAYYPPADATLVTDGEPVRNVTGLEAPEVFPARTVTVNGTSEDWTAPPVGNVEPLTPPVAPPTVKPKPSKKRKGK